MTTAKLSASALKPGPDMDALVHMALFDSPGALVDLKTGERVQLAKPYSTSDAAALEVLKRFGHIQLSRYNEDLWECLAWGDDGLTYEYFAATIAEAVSKAALRAKGIIE